jgi:hypothetical protein
MESDRVAGPVQRVTSQQALWSCAIAVAIVFVLGVMFYGINAADQRQTASAPAPATTATQTTGTGEQSTTTGQGGGAAKQDQPQNKQ